MMASILGPDAAYRPKPYLVPMGYGTFAEIQNASYLNQKV